MTLKSGLWGEQGKGGDKNKLFGIGEKEVQRSEVYRASGGQGEDRTLPGGGASCTVGLQRPALAVHCR